VLATSTESDKTPVKLGSRGKRLGGGSSTKAGISNIEDLDDIVTGGRAGVQGDVLSDEGVNHGLEGWR
jgi:hypothetical protein